MRVIVTADWHVDNDRWGPQEDALPLRVRDHLDRLDAITYHAYEVQADAILVGGDLFRSAHPPQPVLHAVAEKLNDMAQIAPVYISIGNHDMGAMDAPHVASVFDLLGDNIHAPRVPEVYELPEASLVVFPWVRKTHLRAMGLDAPGLIRQVLVGLLASCKASVRVLLAHGTVPGAAFGSERSVLLGDDVIWPLDMIPEFAVNFFGHIHKHQEPVAGKAWYPGSIERCTFGERDDIKGFLDATITAEGNEVEFIKLPSRPMIQIETTPSDLQADLAAVDAGGAIVKVVLRAAAGERVPPIEVPGAAHVRVAVERERKERVRLIGVKIDEMPPLDQLDTYLISRDVPEDRRLVLAQYAQEIMEEVEDV